MLFQERRDNCRTVVFEMGNLNVYLLFLSATIVLGLSFHYSEIFACMCILWPYSQSSLALFPMHRNKPTITYLHTLALFVNILNLGQVVIWMLKCMSIHKEEIIVLFPRWFYFWPNWPGIKYPQVFITMMKSGSYVCISNVVKVSSAGS